METEYARLFDRVKAAVMDSIVIIAAMYAITEIFTLFENIPDYARIIAAVFIFVLYEPIFVNRFGGTIGHSFNNISVKKDRNIDENISFPIALIRFLIKVLLGWISLLTITANKKGKAIHDFVANSVVIENGD